MMDSAPAPVLTCPESHQQLSVAPREILEQINLLIVEGKIINRGNQILTSPLTAGLIRADGKVVYPIKNKIALLLAAEAIELPLTD